jgi:hypothetical protein
MRLVTLALLAAAYVASAAHCSEEALGNVVIKLRPAMLTCAIGDHIHGKKEDFHCTKDCIDFLDKGLDVTDGEVDCIGGCFASRASVEAC